MKNLALMRDPHMSTIERHPLLTPTVLKAFPFPNCLDQAWYITATAATSQCIGHSTSRDSPTNIIVVLDSLST
jgi:hypothetical protein